MKLSVEAKTKLTKQLVPIAGVLLGVGGTLLVQDITRILSFLEFPDNIRSQLDGRCRLQDHKGFAYLNYPLAPGEVIGVDNITLHRLSNDETGRERVIFYTGSGSMESSLPARIDKNGNDGKQLTVFVDEQGIKVMKRCNISQ